MRKYLLINITAILVLIPTMAFAAPVTVSDDTTLNLPNDGTNYTLSAGSTFDQLDISGSSFTFSMSTGETVTLISVDKKALTTNPAVTVTCGSSQSSIVLSLPAGVSAQSFTVTPSGSCSGSTTTGGGGSPSIGQVTSSSGGGGGGGSSSAPTPTPTPATTPTPQTTPSSTSGGTANQQVGASSGSTLTLARPVFFKNLSRGNQGSEVRQLQTLLSQDKSIYPEGKTNGVFGPATFRAVKKFQKKYGIRQTGIVGPQTRTKLMQVFGQQSSSSVPPATPAQTVTIQGLQDQLAQLLQQLQELQKNKK